MTRLSVALYDRELAKYLLELDLINADRQTRITPARIGDPDKDARTSQGLLAIHPAGRKKNFYRKHLTDYRQHTCNDFLIQPKTQTVSTDIFNRTLERAGDWPTDFTVHIYLEAPIGTLLHSSTPLNTPYSYRELTVLA
jgi:hypothetical protein